MALTLTFPCDDIAPAIASWPVKNRDYQYHLLSFQGAEELVKKHYAHRPHVRDTFLDLQFPVLRSDLIRYLTLESEGGVYSDVDTICRYPLHEWIPQEVASKVRAIVGIEYDKLASDPTTDDSNIEEMLQFCQWTMAASPGHPIMTKVINKVVANLHEFALNTSSSLATLQPEDSDVVKITGPVVFTAAVMESIAEQTGQAVSHLNFTGTTSPRLFGDLLVLSVDGFATGQTHSGASRGGEDPPTSLARHLWKGTWKHDWSN